MSGRPEQIDSKGPLYWLRNSKVNKWLKKLGTRFERRAAKKDPEVSPTYKKYKGWTL
jgi:hypothetical protein